MKGSAVVYEAKQQEIPVVPSISILAIKTVLVEMFSQG